jgi:hypothetical protein
VIKPEDKRFMKIKTRHQKAAVPALRVDESMSLEEQVAKRAHELWHQRGYEHGADLADWFQAEQEVNERHQQRLRNSA